MSPSIARSGRWVGLSLTFCLTVLISTVISAEEESAAPAPRTADAATPLQEEDRREQEIAAGHSAHGDAFNEGPRQAASFIPGVGDVHFECSCASPEVQQFIDQGVGQLHGFWYWEAERSFRQAAMLDPECAIAYWGMAMANTNNAERAKGFIAEAMKIKDKVTPRETLYIEALNAFHNAEKKGDEDKKRRQAFVKAYENILHQFPDDIEAKAFLCLQLYDNRGKGIPISSYFAVNALLNEVLAVNPLHPCHHYVIHLWDYEKPERALKSAAACGPAAPAIAHMWHMPGHIYSRLKRYQDAVWQQEASARVDHAHIMRTGLMPDQIHNFAHNNEWLIRNLIFIGRAQDALNLAMNMIDMPRHPKFNTLKKGSANFGRTRLVQVINDFERWDDVIRLQETRYLEPTEKQEEQLKRVRLLGRAYLRVGDSNGAAPILKELRERQTGLELERDEAVARAERILKAVGKSQEEIDAEKKEEQDKYNKQLGPLGQTLYELNGLEHFAEGRYSEALENLQKAGSQPATLMSLVHLRAGNTDKALELINKEVRGHKNETLPLAHQTYILWEAGKRDEAQKAFESLRKISATIDFSSPVFARLAPIASELGWPADWRLPATPAQDLGDRPNLDDLGPFRWSPSAAPDWTLEDHLATTWSLSHFKGKPVLVIFYLGHGCLHCAEQLGKFAPESGRFRDAGIEIIAISTDPPNLLQKKLEAFSDDDYPFPLVSNASLDVFKAYHCFDDFERQPLHGTFLIDADGLIRWQDISYEPFMDPRFVLAESKRLLSDGPVDPETSEATAGNKSDSKDGESGSDRDKPSGDEKPAENEPGSNNAAAVTPAAAGP
ncbi:MAG: redoxin domain-containing protein [Planctomycetaceae bacterium]